MKLDPSMYVYSWMLGHLHTTEKYAGSFLGFFMPHLDEQTCNESCPETEAKMLQLLQRPCRKDALPVNWPLPLIVSIRGHVWAYESDPKLEDEKEDDLLDP